MFGTRANIDPPALMNVVYQNIAGSVLDDSRVFGEECVVGESDGDLDEPGDITFDKEMDQEEDDITVVPDLNPEVPLEHPLDGNMHSSDLPFDKDFSVKKPSDNAEPCTKDREDHVVSDSHTHEQSKEVTRRAQLKTTSTMKPQKSSLISVYEESQKERVVARREAMDARESFRQKMLIEKRMARTQKDRHREVQDERTDRRAEKKEGSFVSRARQ
ncbi:hypothetical protein R1sor_017698 [Riccia sorocarpa]|uniref:Uncharacterized protein n=1 Tax=Riccia sorocarpa TaxID=122646 RepID=A0ABD3I8Q4_9MARC